MKMQLQWKTEIFVPFLKHKRWVWRISEKNQSTQRQSYSSATTATRNLT